MRVLIESGDEHERWGTVGVSHNVIEASWQALVDSIDYKLYRSRRGRAGVSGSATVRIYLDHNASAPLRPEAREAMLAVLGGPPAIRRARIARARARARRSRRRAPRWRR